MEIIQTPDFKSTFQKLPKEIQKLYELQESRFRSNWRDPRLRIKKVKDLPHTFSFRITRRYRVFFYFHKPETAIFFAIGHRKDIYRRY